MTNPPISRDTIRGILERLNNNRPSRRSPCFSITDDLIENIYDALNEYADIIRINPFFADKKDRIERMREILDTGKAFLKSINIAKRHEDLTVFKTDIPDKLKYYYDIIIDSARNFHDLESNDVNMAGRPKIVEREVFIYRLADAYEQATGRKPGKASDGTGGPFLRFVAAFLREVDKSKTTNSQLIAAIRKVLKNRPS